MSEEKEFNSDVIISKLIKLYEEEIVDAFIKNKRYDLLVGFIFTEKMHTYGASGREKRAILRNDGTIAFQKEIFDRSLDQSVSNDVKNNKSFFVMDSGALVRKIEEVYNKKIAGKNIEPNINWKQESANYITPKYIDALNNAHKIIEENGSGWDYLSFAQKVPHADVQTLENKIIMLQNPLLIMAFAHDVRRANIDKLRKAIEIVGDNHDVAVFYEEHGDGNSQKERS